MTEDDGRIDIMVRNSHGAVTHFRAKPNQPLVKLMKTYCTKENLTMNSVIFTFDGQRIVPDYTPAYIVDGSIIESHTNVTGG